jgi:hypothetical protein
MLIAPDGEVKELKVAGRDQSLLAFSFKDERINPPVSDSIFHFTIPNGAEVVDSVNWGGQENAKGADANRRTGQELARPSGAVLGTPPVLRVFLRK